MNNIFGNSYLFLMTRQGELLFVRRLMLAGDAGIQEVTVFRRHRGNSGLLAVEVRCGVWGGLGIV